MKEVSEEQIAKLPKWAQSAFEALRRENAELVEAIESLKGNIDTPYSTLIKSGYGAGNTKVVQYIDAPHGIDIEMPSAFDSKFTVRLNEDGQLQVMANGYPSSLVVIPQSSNVVLLTTVERPSKLGD